MSADSNFENAKSHAEDAVGAAKSHFQDAVDSSKDHLQSAASDLRAGAEQAYDETRRRARTLQDDGEAYIRENPIGAVLTALAAGFIISHWLRR